MLNILHKHIIEAILNEKQLLKLYSNTKTTKYKICYLKNTFINTKIISHISFLNINIILSAILNSKTQWRSQDYTKLTKLVNFIGSKVKYFI